MRFPPQACASSGLALNASRGRGAGMRAAAQPEPEASGSRFRGRGFVTEPRLPLKRRSPGGSRIRICSSLDMTAVETGHSRVLLTTRARTHGSHARAERARAAGRLRARRNTSLRCRNGWSVYFLSSSLISVCLGLFHRELKARE